MIKTSDKTFNKDTIEKKEPFALLFTSNTCPHCRTAEAIIRNIEVNEQNKGFNTYVASSEDSRKLIEKYGIRSFPTMFFFGVDFKNKHTILGAQSVYDFLNGYEKMHSSDKKSFLSKVKSVFK
jgi:thiol-disulfide isomerase/thioredoxin